MADLETARLDVGTDGGDQIERGDQQLMQEANRVSDDVLLSTPPAGVYGGDPARVAIGQKHGGAVRYPNAAGYAWVLGGDGVALQAERIASFRMGGGTAWILVPCTWRKKRMRSGATRQLFACDGEVLVHASWVISHLAREVERVEGLVADSSLACEERVGEAGIGQASCAKRSEWFHDTNRISSSFGAGKPSRVTKSGQSPEG